MSSETIADRLRRLVPDRQKSESARKCGIAQKTFASYLAGTEPTASKLVQLANGLGVDLEWLATGRGPEKRSIVGTESNVDHQARARLGAAEERLRSVGDFRSAMLRGDSELLEIKNELFAIRDSTADEFARARADLDLHLAFSDEGASARNKAREESVFAKMREANEVATRVFAEVGWEPPLPIVEAIKLLVFSYGLTESDAIDVLHLIKAGVGMISV